jgi:hypothetical protein
LALTLLLAATKTFEWERGGNILAPKRKEPDYEPDDGPLTNDQIDQIRKMANNDLPTGKVINKESLFEEPELEPVPTKKEQILAGLDSMWNRARGLVTKDSEADHAPIEELAIDDHVEDDYLDPVEKEARRKWKEANPGETIKHHRRMFEIGLINKLPWMHPDYYPNLGLVADNAPTGATGEVKGFGAEFPSNPTKGDMFLRIDQLPSALYKFNGIIWIEVDKALSDQHAYNDAYIDYLISKISTGEYDPDLLSDAERASIEQRLSTNPLGA